MSSSSSSAFSFKHPGSFLSPQMTRDLAKQVQTNPIRKRAFTKLVEKTPLNYTPKALEIVDIDWGGKGIGHNECTQDGEMSVQAALLFWCTNNNDYASLVCRILSAWARKNKIFRGNNALLEASWSVCSMARAAELIKHSSMANAWKQIEPSFVAWLQTIILPVLRNQSIWRWGFHNNWHFSNLCARMQISILLDDPKEWNICLDIYRRILPSAFVQSECVGETCETKRDVTHAMFLLGGMTQVAEMAYHQGITSAFDERLLQATETQAQIMLQDIPRGLTKECIKTPYGYFTEPVFEIPYAHFHDRCNKEMPFIERLLNKVRPERTTFHWGPNTLTHA